VCAFNGKSLFYFILFFSLLFFCYHFKSFCSFSSQSRFTNLARERKIIFFLSLTSQNWRNWIRFFYSDFIFCDQFRYRRKNNWQYERKFSDYFCHFLDIILCTHCLRLDNFLKESNCPKMREKCSKMRANLTENGNLPFSIFLKFFPHSFPPSTHILVTATATIHPINRFLSFSHMRSFFLLHAVDEWMTFTFHSLSGTMRCVFLGDINYIT